MGQDKIYVRFLDGTASLVAINAQQIQDVRYKILDDEEYENLDSSELFEFYPGDIVEVEDSEELDNVYQYVAKRLILASNRQDRDYLEFKFYSTFRYLPISESTAERYKLVIHRIKKERLEGKFFYRGTLETVDMLEKWYAANIR